MHIKILGTGCSKCSELKRLVKEVITEKELDAEIEEIKDLNKILEYPIITTPGVVIDEKLVSSGRLPSKDDITRLLTETQNK